MVSRVYGYNTHIYTLENYSKADLYYDAITQTTLFFTMQLGCTFHTP